MTGQWKQRITMFAAVTALVAPGIAFAEGPPEEGDEVTQLRAEVAQLRAEVQSLRAEDGEQWLTEQRAEEIRGLVQDVLADADTRASLLQDGLSAGHDGKFFIQSADGSFRLNVGGQVQVRWVLARLERGTTAIDTTRSGFEVRRSKMILDGHIIDPTWKFKIQGAFSNSTGMMAVEDAYVVKKFGNGWNVKVGQFKLPFLREELVSSKRQLAVDRTMVNEEFNQDRGTGVQFEYKGDIIRVALAASTGFGTKNTSALTEQNEYALTARLEGMPIGDDMGRFKDFTSWRGETLALLVGGALHFEKAESGTAAGPEEERFTWTVDTSVEFGGGNIFVALVGNHLEQADLDQLGFVLQGGAFFTDDMEAFVRYEWGDTDKVGLTDLSVITLGVNKYYQKHHLKATVDIGFGLDQVASDFASSGVGWQADSAGQDGQVVVRSQFQLLF